MCYDVSFLNKFAVCITLGPKWGTGFRSWQLDLHCALGLRSNIWYCFDLNVDRQRKKRRRNWGGKGVSGIYIYIYVCMYACVRACDCS